MKLKIRDEKTEGDLLLFKGEDNFDRLYFSRDRSNKYFTIAWNHGPNQIVTIDGARYEFLSNSILTLLFDQSFSFENAADIVAWQFNREFYCMIDHDSEVGCVGFLFGTTEHLFIKPDEEAKRRLNLLLDVFIDEFKTSDNIQHEILLVLLKRLIKYITRLARSEFVPVQTIQDDKFRIIRKFNLLVEANFRSEHSVSFYAEQLCKSPKTLANLFAIYNHKTPSQVIQDRILIEAKRYLSYTEKSVKQITYELGFEDAAYFSNFFKKHTGLSPLDFRNAAVIRAEGK
jgi:AraC-like DNA-binding protein